MTLELLNSLDDKLVLMGMSCSGKTTFAESLPDHKVHHFDAEYKYQLGRLPGVSRKKSWGKIIKGCTEPRFVLDNWSTEDTLGETVYAAHPDACIMVLFDSYPNILGRYRVPIRGQDAHRMMYDKMYHEMPFEKYKKVRYLCVEGGVYKEYDAFDFRTQVYLQDTSTNMIFNRESWTWKDA